MEISPNEAEEALNAIREVMRKTRRIISRSGAYKFLILWGIIWMVGFLNSQFFPEKTASYVWMGLDILGGIVSAVIGIRLNRGVRTNLRSTSGKNIAFFWLLIFLYCAAAIGVAWPVDGKQLAMFFIFFASLGWVAMGLLLSFASAWWGLGLVGLSLIGYFFLPAFFYLWMAILGGGGMIGLGIYVRNRW
jgi:hypothetical protein